MKEIKWVVGLNLLFIITYTVFVYYLDLDQRGIGKSVYLFLPILIQFFSNLLISFLLHCFRRAEWALAFLLSSGICLVVGASSCVAIF